MGIELAIFVVDIFTYSNILADMRELRINSKLIRPSRSEKLDPKVWASLQECADKKSRGSLPPVVLIQMYDDFDRWGRCLYDGNHRVSLTEVYGGYVYAVLFTIEEAMSNDYLESFGLYSGAMSEVRRHMRLARERGLDTWQSLIPNS